MSSYHFKVHGGCGSTSLSLTLHTDFTFSLDYNHHWMDSDNISLNEKGKYKNLTEQVSLLTIPKEDGGHVQFHLFRFKPAVPVELFWYNEKQETTIFTDMNTSLDAGMLCGTDPTYFDAVLVSNGSPLLHEKFGQKPYRLVLDSTCKT